MLYWREAQLKALICGIICSQTPTKWETASYFCRCYNFVIFHSFCHFLVPGYRSRDGLPRKKPLGLQVRGSAGAKREIQRPTAPLWRSTFGNLFYWAAENIAFCLGDSSRRSRPPGSLYVSFVLHSHHQQRAGFPAAAGRRWVRAGLPVSTEFID